MRFGETFRALASKIQQVQRSAIEIENRPSLTKALKPFTTTEAADMIGITVGYLRQVLAQEACPSGSLTGSKRRMFTFEEVQGIRQFLYATGGDVRYSPRRRPGEKLQVISFPNFKGGSAKTTSAVHCAQYFALSGYRVLMIDLDAQGSATALFGFDPTDDVQVDSSFAGWVLRDKKRDATSTASGTIRQTYWPTIDLVAAGSVLHQAEYAILKREQEATTDGSTVYIYYDELPSFLRRVGESYDIAVLDVRPDVNMLMVNALHASSGIVIPVPASMVDLASSAEFFRFLADYYETITRVDPSAFEFDFVKLLPTKFRPNDKTQGALLNLMQFHFKEVMMPVSMIDTTMIPAASIRKETLYEYEPASDKRTYDRAIEAVNEVNQAIEAEVLKAWGRSPEARRESAA